MKKILLTLLFAFGLLVGKTQKGNQSYQVKTDNCDKVFAKTKVVKNFFREDAPFRAILLKNSYNLDTFYLLKIQEKVLFQGQKLNSLYDCFDLGKYVGEPVVLLLGRSFYLYYYDEKGKYFQKKVLTIPIKVPEIAGSFFISIHFLFFQQTK